MSKKYKFFATTAGIIIVALIGFAIFQFSIMFSVINTDKIYNGITISGIDVGGLSENEAKEKLLIGNQKLLETPILKLTYESFQKDLFYKDIIADNNLDTIVNKAFKFGRDGNFFSRYAFISDLKRNHHNFDITYTPDKAKSFLILDSIKAQVETVPESAKMTKNAEQPFVIIPEKLGKTIDYEKTYNDITTAFLINKNEAIIAMKIEKPKYTKEDLLQIQTKLGSFSTKFSSSDAGRNENLRIATSYINGTILEPGEILSVNTAIKDRIAANGYKLAHVIENGEIVDGIGGGICQVATTLYNAVLYSELEVVERHNHSLQVGYVKAGRDATVASADLDFRFRNSTNKPIYIQGYMTASTLNYAIYGEVTYVPKNKIDFETVYIKKLPAVPEKRIDDPTLPVGTTKVTEKSKEGLVVKVYKLVFNNDNTLLSRTYLNQSTYKSAMGKMLVGSKPIDLNITTVPVVDESSISN